MPLLGTDCLWQTPGVAGLWVEKGSVATGEAAADRVCSPPALGVFLAGAQVVELLSSPQASEGPLSALH